MQIERNLIISWTECLKKKQAMFRLMTDKFLTYICKEKSYGWAELACFNICIATLLIIFPFLSMIVICEN